MPIAYPREQLLSLCRYLDGLWTDLDKEHRRLRPNGSEIAVGGAHMDSFFRMCFIEGVQEGVRKGYDPKKSIQTGKDRSREAVKIWNSRREYQVRRSEETAFGLENLVWSFLQRPFP